MAKAKISARVLSPNFVLVLVPTPRCSALASPHKSLKLQENAPECTMSITGEARILRLGGGLSPGLGEHGSTSLYGGLEVEPPMGIQGAESPVGVMGRSPLP